MKKSVYVFLADGFEEMEAVTVIDILRRGGLDVKTVSVTASDEVKGAHGIGMRADIMFDKTDKQDILCMVLPGGLPGAENLAKHPGLIAMLQEHYDAGGYVAAICAAPGLVLSKLKLSGKATLTTYPGFEDYIEEADVVNDGVVADENLITAKGPAFAPGFGLTILEILTDSKNAKEVAEGMLY